MISLVGRDVQYTITEATRTLSLQADNVHENDDALWMGCNTIPRGDGLCAHAVDYFTEKLDHKGRPDAKRKYFIIDDLAKCARYLDKTFVTQWPKNRFYAAVPIRTAAGYVIGAYSVFDDLPRSGLTPAEQSFMSDMAITLMNHIETSRIRGQHQRAETMIKGMGLFMEGKSSLREWWLENGRLAQQSKPSSASIPTKILKDRADEIFGVENGNSDLSDDEAVKTSLRPELTSRPSRGSALSTIYSKSTEPVFSRPRTASASTNTEGCPMETADADIVDNEPAPSDQEMLSRDMKLLFSRASSLIRQAITVDGAAFLDASVGTFGGGTSNIEMCTITRDELSADAADGSLPVVYAATPDGLGEEMEQSTSDMFKAQHSGPSKSSKEERLCGILGYSTRRRSDSSVKKHLRVPEAFLRRLLRRHPHGKIFNFEYDGSFSSSEEHDSGDGASSYGRRPRTISKSQKRRASNKAEANFLQQLLPGVRSAAMYPLWDAHKERWYAVSLVWTTSGTRVLDSKEDLNYLAAFGNSIMAEVSRLNALVADHSKSSFISSISHELRSPLHGVLAGVEFLHDTLLDPVQHDMITTVDECGRTLLDVINHILDFSQTRHAAKGKKQKNLRYRRNGQRVKQLPTPKHTALDSSEPQSSEVGAQIGGSDVDEDEHGAVDLVVLTEEVMNSVLAGSVYGGYNTKPLAVTFEPNDLAQSYNRSKTIAVRNDNIMVIVDIDWRASWAFVTDPGAWRRVVMNLFGNALKYTTAGYIKVSLTCSDVPSLPGRGDVTMVRLEVKDSGKGISQEFLRHHLYTPFKQENALAVGSGLGLSIVREIVENMGGSIEFESELGIGTEARVSWLFDRSMPSPKKGALVNEYTDFNTHITQACTKTRGRKVCLAAFDVYPNIGETPTGILSVEAERMLSLKSALASLLSSWFGMEVSYSSSLDMASADIAITMKAEFDASTQSGPGEAGSGRPPLIVLGAHGTSTMRLSNHYERNMVYLQQP